MDYLTYIIFGVVAVPFLVTAFFLLQGKGGFLIAGYNTKSKEEKARYDEKALCRSVGKLMLAVTAGIFLIPIGVGLDSVVMLYGGIAFLIVAPLIYIIYASTGNRFLKPAAEGDQSVPNVGVLNKKPSNKLAVIITSVITTAVLAAVGVLLLYGSKEPAVNVLNGEIQIKGMYGLTVRFGEISGVTLVEKNMREIGPGRRVNGYGGIGSALKGNFRSGELGDILLFVQSDSSPTILISRPDKKDIYISFKDGEDTRALYNKMKNSFN